MNGTLGASGVLVIAGCMAGGWIYLRKGGNSLSRFLGRRPTSAEGPQIERLVAVCVAAVAQNLIVIHGHALGPRVLAVQVPAALLPLVEALEKVITDEIRRQSLETATARAAGDNAVFKPADDFRILPPVAGPTIAAVASHVAFESNPFEITMPADERDDSDQDSDTEGESQDPWDTSFFSAPSRGGWVGTVPMAMPMTTPYGSPARVDVDVEVAIDGGRPVNHRFTLGNDEAIPIGREMVESGVVIAPQVSTVSGQHGVLSVEGPSDLFYVDRSSYGTWMLESGVWKKLRPRTRVRLASGAILALDEGRTVLVTPRLAQA